MLEYFEEIFQGFFRKYSKAKIAFLQLISIALGLSRQNSSTELLSHAAILKIMNTETYPSQPTVSRFYKNVSLEEARRVETLNCNLLRRVRNFSKRFILDLDTHVITV